ncbi:hypothetical protein PC123_g26903 [Phytophthora cactorum]|nr:hypothetical protein PC123_g26903 [Phytophthora cactorum]
MSTEVAVAFCIAVIIIVAISRMCERDFSRLHAATFFRCFRFFTALHAAPFFRRPLFMTLVIDAYRERRVQPVAWPLLPPQARGPPCPHLHITPR